jgi:hypothetical protein
LAQQLKARLFDKGTFNFIAQASHTAPCLRSKDNPKTKTYKIKKHLLLPLAETPLPISIKSSSRSNLLYLKGQSISLIPKPNFKSLIRNNSKINKKRKSCCKKSMGQSLV